MPELTIATDTERVTLTAERTEWTHDETLLCYADGTQIAEFPTAQWVARTANLE